MLQAPTFCPETPSKGAIAGDQLKPCLLAVAGDTLRGTSPTALRQILFLPARAHWNNLLCRSCCVGTKHQSSVHSNVCKQLLPLISSAMLSKHRFPPAVAGTTNCGQTPLNPIYSPCGQSHSHGVSSAFASLAHGHSALHLSPRLSHFPFSWAHRTHKSRNHVPASATDRLSPGGHSNGLKSWGGLALSRCHCDLTICLIKGISTSWSLPGCFPCPASGKLTATTKLFCQFAWLSHPEAPVLVVLANFLLANFPEKQVITKGGKRGHGPSPA